jgi:DNA-binding phage protein
MRTMTVAVKAHAAVLGQGTPYVKEQLRLITETAEKMEKYSGYSEAINLSAANTLVKLGAQANGVATLEKGMNDYLAATIGASASMGDMTGLAEQIGAMIQSGRGRGLAQFGATKDEIASFGKMTDVVQRLNLVYKVLERTGKDQANPR